MGLWYTPPDGDETFRERSHALADKWLRENQRRVSLDGLAPFHHLIPGPLFHAIREFEKAHPELYRGARIAPMLPDPLRVEDYANQFYAYASIMRSAVHLRELEAFEKTMAAQAKANVRYQMLAAMTKSVSPDHPAANSLQVLGEYPEYMLDQYERSQNATAGAIVCANCYWHGKWDPTCQNLTFTAKDRTARMVHPNLHFAECNLAQELIRRHRAGKGPKHKADTGMTVKTCAHCGVDEVDGSLVRSLTTCLKIREAIGKGAIVSDDVTNDQQPQQQRKLMACLGCKSVYYCSRECQKAAWPRHKKGCQAAAAQLSFKDSSQDAVVVHKEGSSHEPAVAALHKKGRKKKGRKKKSPSSPAAA